LIRISINIQMIAFNRCDHSHFGIKGQEGAVVFVGFDYCIAAVIVNQQVAVVIGADPAEKGIAAESAFGKNVRYKGRRGRFTVRTGNSDGSKFGYQLDRKSVV